MLDPFNHNKSNPTHYDWQAGERFHKGAKSGVIIDLSEDGVVVQFDGEDFATSYDLTMLMSFKKTGDKNLYYFKDTRQEIENNYVNLNDPATKPIEEGSNPPIQMYKPQKNIQDLSDNDIDTIIDNLL